MKISPEDVVEGSDMTVEMLGRSLIEFGKNIQQGYSISEGNIEWLERQASFMRETLESQRDDEEDERWREEQQAQYEINNPPLEAPWWEGV